MMTKARLELERRWTLLVTEQMDLDQRLAEVREELNGVVIQRELLRLELPILKELAA